jgi:hypothetical protein
VSELEETIKDRMEDVLASIYQQTQCPHKELDSRIEETQRDLEISLGTRTWSLHEEIAETIRTCLRRWPTRRRTFIRSTTAVTIDSGACMTVAMTDIVAGNLKRKQSQ